MSTPGDIEVHDDDLRRIRSTLDDAGRGLFGHARDLDGAPDAGASSGEVADALASLSSAVAGLAQHIGSLVEATAAVGADFAGTDGAVSDAMRRRMGEVGP